MAKGGDANDTVGRKCVCNGLLANVGFPQIRNGKRIEHGLITAGDDLSTVSQFLKPGRTEYSAADVINHLLRGCEELRSTQNETRVAVPA
jgi:nitronate monooxygenase